MRAALLLGVLAFSSAAHAGVASELARVDALLHQSLVSDAADVAEKLYLNFPDVPAVQAAAGKVKFYQSDYQGAVTLLERAAESFKGGNEAAADDALEGSLLELVRATRDATKGFVATDSPHFSFRAAPGKDQLLAPYALEALEGAYERIGGDFDWHPRERIIVEFYPSARALAAVSTLTEKEIETSGTIAICKFNRLMVTTPRALLRGYAWIDTVAHEYTHLIITQKSHNTVGIWLHEGLAKFSETRWAGNAGEALGLWQENLLGKAVRADKLITFEQMHPSMAKLPSQHDTALAFAEVFTVIEYLHKGGPACAQSGRCPAGTLTGYAVTNAIIERMRDGEPDEQAIEHVLGVSFEDFKLDWMKWLKARPQKTTPGAEMPKLRFKKGQQKDDEDRDNDVDEGLGSEVKRYARLGNMLRKEGRPRAAAMQYERAVKSAGLTTPMLHNRLASAYLESGQDNRALETLKQVEQIFPDYAQTHIQMGRIHFKRGEWEAARTSYLMANRQNPFNPEIHAALSDIHDRLGAKDLARQEVLAYQLLNAPPPNKVSPGAAVGVPAAMLSLETRPWAQLVVDDVDVGLMTPVEIELKPGHHTLHLKNPALAVDKTLPLDVAPGDHARIRLDLTQP